MDAWVVEVGADPLDNDRLLLVGDSVVNLLRAQETNAEHVCQLGHVPKILSVAKACAPFTSHSALLILQPLLSSTYVLENLSNADPITPLLQVIQGTPEEAFVVSNVMYQMLSHDTPRAGLANLAVKIDMVGVLLKILEKGIDHTCEKPAATRALLVNCIKIIAENEIHGDRIQEQLSKCPLWASLEGFPPPKDTQH
eukprot:NODE_780_length_1455_cov_82.120199_g644_i0.p1 GENE.NODE_780_length_1455_cov_82.120199_g644_i0~~NODE_780_length_1455_cov_82.120199_g644_i0.p1  ORF type:complete len:197 (-),score=50.15 NODE_780_length_1455_cov_82.120199_g644_i0:214-804(-)